MALLYAYTNHISPEFLTDEGPYCIPASDVAAIMEKTCGNLDPNSELLQRFFAAHSFSRDVNQSTCLAFMMVYTFMDFSELDLDRQTERIAAVWERIRRGPYRIQSSNRYALSIADQEEGPPTTLARELKQLPVDEDFFACLLEAFSDFSYQISLLRELVRPVAERLTQLLIPYVERAMPLIDSWEQLFRHSSVEAMLQNRGAIKVEQPLTGAWLILRYLDCQGGFGLIRPESNELTMLLGVGLKPSLAPACQGEDPTDDTLAAIRLLGDRGRSRIIRALQRRPMSMQELANQLDTNPGTVFRNLNSMANTHLLDKEIRDNRYYYRTNIEYVRAVFDHMLNYYTSDE